MNIDQEEKQSTLSCTNTSRLLLRSIPHDRLHRSQGQDLENRCQWPNIPHIITVAITCYNGYQWSHNQFPGIRPVGRCLWCIFTITLRDRIMACWVCVCFTQQTELFIDPLVWTQLSQTDRKIQTLMDRSWFQWETRFHSGKSNLEVPLAWEIVCHL